MDRWVGATPFWLAAKFLELDMMRALAAGGADTRLPSKDGVTPLMAAAGLGYSRGVVDAFVKDRRDFSSYPGTGEFGTDIPPGEEKLALDAVKTAIALGADVNAADEAGNTALHAAASHGMNTIVRFLAERGAELDVKNKIGLTPLSIVTRAQSIPGTGLARDVVREQTATVLRQLGAKE
jgi:ankyrin repeat protein